MRDLICEIWNYWYKAKLQKEKYSLKSLFNKTCVLAWLLTIAQLCWSTWYHYTWKYQLFTTHQEYLKQGESIHGVEHAWDMLNGLSFLETRDQWLVVNWLFQNIYFWYFSACISKQILNKEWYIHRIGIGHTRMKLLALKSWAFKDGSLIDR